VLEPIDPVAPRIVTVLGAALVFGRRATFAAGCFCFVEVIK
jgi:hypothetical protein